MQDVCAKPQLLWIHENKSHVWSTGHCSRPSFPPAAQTLFLPPSLSRGVRWRLWYRFLFKTNHSQSPINSTLPTDMSAFTIAHGKKKLPWPRMKVIPIYGYKQILRRKVVNRKVIKNPPAYTWLMNDPFVEKKILSRTRRRVRGRRKRRKKRRRKKKRMKWKKKEEKEGEVEGDEEK